MKLRFPLSEAVTDTVRGRWFPYGAFPPAVQTRPRVGETDAAVGVWLFLLPYFEQEPLARRYRWDLDWFDPPNLPIAGTQVKVFQCPSAEPNRLGGGITPDRGPGACMDYAPTLQVGPALANRTPALVDQVGNYRGALDHNYRVRLADITDGTSTTIQIAEDAGRPKRWLAGRRSTSAYTPGGPWVSGPNRIVVRGASPDGTTPVGPCALNCTNDRDVYSFHIGGANVLMADGSVRFLNAGMDIRILARLSTRAGGEVVVVP
jgi:prepilin-type processing-associated H-X9-DG protein